MLMYVDIWMGLINLFNMSCNFVIAGKTKYWSFIWPLIILINGPFLIFVVILYILRKVYGAISRVSGKTIFGWRLIKWNCKVTFLWQAMCGRQGGSGGTPKLRQNHQSIKTSSTRCVPQNTQNHQNQTHQHHQYRQWEFVTQSMYLDA